MSSITCLDDVPSLARKRKFTFRDSALDLLTVTFATL